MKKHFVKSFSFFISLLKFWFNQLNRMKTTWSLVRYFTYVGIFSGFIQTEPAVVNLCCLSFFSLSCEKNISSSKLNCFSTTIDHWCQTVTSPLWMFDQLLAQAGENINDKTGYTVYLLCWRLWSLAKVSAAGTNPFAFCPRNSCWGVGRWESADTGWCHSCYYTCCSTANNASPSDGTPVLLQWQQPCPLQLYYCPLVVFDKLLSTLWCSEGGKSRTNGVT